MLDLCFRLDAHSFLSQGSMTVMKSDVASWVTTWWVPTQVWGFYHIRMIVRYCVGNEAPGFHHRFFHAMHLFTKFTRKCMSTMSISIAQVRNTHFVLHSPGEIRAVKHEEGSFPVMFDGEICWKYVFICLSCMKLWLKIRFDGQYKHI